VRYRVIIRPEAEEEAAEAARWYEAQSRGLGRAFIRSFRDLSRSLRSNPLRFPLVDDDARRALMGRYPYGVFFEVHDDEVVVLACFHLARDPNALRRRLGQR
jgi:toxin ParE1/3/4